MSMQRSDNVAWTSMQRHGVASMLMQRFINVMCPLGFKLVSTVFTLKLEHINSYHTCPKIHFTYVHVFKNYMSE